MNDSADWDEFKYLKSLIIKIDNYQNDLWMKIDLMFIKMNCEKTFPMKFEDEGKYIDQFCCWMMSLSVAFLSMIWREMLDSEKQNWLIENGIEVNLKMIISSSDVVYFKYEVTSNDEMKKIFNEMILKLKEREMKYWDIVSSQSDSILDSFRRFRISSLPVRILK